MGVNAVRGRDGKILTRDGKAVFRVRVYDPVSGQQPERTVVGRREANAVFEDMTRQKRQLNDQQRPLI